jgi:hypothetical protein
VIHLPRKYSRFTAKNWLMRRNARGRQVYQKDHALCPRPLRAVDFNLPFAGISISTLAAGEFSNSPPACANGASAYVGVLAPIRRTRTGSTKMDQRAAHYQDQANKLRKMADLEPEMSAELLGLAQQCQELADNLNRPDECDYPPG